jgi:leucyl-tRNA synthetase
LTNELRALKCHKRAILEPAVILIAPFAPHLAEELWRQFGYSGTVCDAEWPSYQEAYLQREVVVLPVQINGKHRGNIEVAVGMEASALEQLVMEQEFVQRNLGGAAVKKFIFVQNRIINIVI